MGRGICHPAWWPEFDNQDSWGRENRLLKAVLCSPHVYIHRINKARRQIITVVMKTEHTWHGGHSLSTSERSSANSPTAQESSLSICPFCRQRLSKATSPVQHREVGGCRSQARTHSLDGPALHTPKAMIKMRSRQRCCRRSHSRFSSLPLGEEKAMNEQLYRVHECGAQRSQTDSHPGTISPSP